MVAAAMFDTDAGAVSGDEVADAVGELANIIGGNIKGMIADPCELSLPMVATGENYSVRIPGTEVVSEVTLSSAGHPFRISVARRVP